MGFTGMDCVPASGTVNSLSRAECVVATCKLEVCDPEHGSADSVWERKAESEEKGATEESIYRG